MVSVKFNECLEYIRVIKDKEIFVNLSGSEMAAKQNLWAAPNNILSASGKEQSHIFIPGQPITIAYHFDKHGVRGKEILTGLADYQNPDYLFCCYRIDVAKILPLLEGQDEHLVAGCQNVLFYDAHQWIKQVFPQLQPQEALVYWEGGGLLVYRGPEDFVLCDLGESYIGQEAFRIIQEQKLKVPCRVILRCDPARPKGPLPPMPSNTALQDSAAGGTAPKTQPAEQEQADNQDQDTDVVAPETSLLEAAQSQEQDTAEDSLFEESVVTYEQELPSIDPQKDLDLLKNYGIENTVQGAATSKTARGPDGCKVKTVRAGQDEAKSGTGTEEEDDQTEQDNDYEESVVVYDQELPPIGPGDLDIFQRYGIEEAQKALEQGGPPVAASSTTSETPGKEATPASAEEQEGQAVAPASTAHETSSAEVYDTELQPADPEFLKQQGIAVTSAPDTTSGSPSLPPPPSFVKKLQKQPPDQDSQADSKDLQDALTRMQSASATGIIPQRPPVVQDDTASEILPPRSQTGIKPMTSADNLEVADAAPEPPAPPLPPAPSFLQKSAPPPASSAQEEEEFLATSSPAAAPAESKMEESPTAASDDTDQQALEKVSAEARTWDEMTEEKFPTEARSWDEIVPQDAAEKFPEEAHTWDKMTQDQECEYESWVDLSDESFVAKFPEEARTWDEMTEEPGSTSDAATAVASDTGTPQAPASSQDRVPEAAPEVPPLDSAAGVSSQTSAPAEKMAPKPAPESSPVQPSPKPDTSASRDDFPRTWKDMVASATPASPPPVAEAEVPKAQEESALQPWEEMESPLASEEPSKTAQTSLPPPDSSQAKDPGATPYPMESFEVDIPAKAGTTPAEARTGTLDNTGRREQMVLEQVLPPTRQQTQMRPFPTVGQAPTVLRRRPPKSPRRLPRILKIILVLLIIVPPLAFLSWQYIQKQLRRSRVREEHVAPVTKRMRMLFNRLTPIKRVLFAMQQEFPEQKLPPKAVSLYKQGHSLAKKLRKVIKAAEKAIQEDRLNDAKVMMLKYRRASPEFVRILAALERTTPEIKKMLLTARQRKQNTQNARASQKLLKIFKQELAKLRKELQPFRETIDLFEKSFPPAPSRSKAALENLEQEARQWEESIKQAQKAIEAKHYSEALAILRTEPDPEPYIFTIKSHLATLQRELSKARRSKQEAITTFERITRDLQKHHAQLVQQIKQLETTLQSLQKDFGIKLPAAEKILRQARQARNEWQEKLLQAGQVRKSNIYAALQLIKPYEHNPLVLLNSVARCLDQTTRRLTQEQKAQQSFQENLRKAKQRLQRLGICLSSITRLRQSLQKTITRFQNNRIKWKGSGYQSLPSNASQLVQKAGVTASRWLRLRRELQGLIAKEPAKVVQRLNFLGHGDPYEIRNLQAAIRTINQRIETNDKIYMQRQKAKFSKERELAKRYRRAPGPWYHSYYQRVKIIKQMLPQIEKNTHTFKDYQRVLSLKKHIRVAEIDYPNKMAELEIYLYRIKKKGTNIYQEVAKDKKSAFGYSEKRTIEAVENFLRTKTLPLGSGLMHEQRDIDECIRKLKREVAVGKVQGETLKKLNLAFKMFDRAFQGPRSPYRGIKSYLIQKEMQ